MKRLLELFEGPEAPGPWAPPEMPAALHALLPWRAFDESSELYVNAASDGVRRSSCRRSPASTPRPWGRSRARWPTRRRSAARCRSSTGRARASARRRASWAEPRRNAGGALARMGSGRRDLLASGGWRRLHEGGPPFTLSRLPGVRHRLPHGPARPGRGDRARRVPPGAGGHARLGGRRRPGGWSPTRCCRSRPSWSRPTSADIATAGPSVRRAAGRPAIRCTSSASRPAARSRSTRPG